MVGFPDGTEGRLLTRVELLRLAKVNDTFRRLDGRALRVASFDRTLDNEQRLEELTRRRSRRIRLPA